MFMRILFAVTLLTAVPAQVRSEERQITTILNPQIISVERTTSEKKDIAWSRCYATFQTNDKQTYLAAIKPAANGQSPDAANVKFEVDRKKGYITLIVDGGETITEMGQGSRDGMQSRGEHDSLVWKFASVPNRVMVVIPDEGGQAKKDTFYLATLEAIGNGQRIVLACDDCRSVRAAFDSRFEPTASVNAKPTTEPVTPKPDPAPQAPVTQKLPRSKEVQGYEKLVVNFTTHVKNRNFSEAAKLAKAPWFDSIDNRLVTSDEELAKLLPQRLNEANPDRQATDVTEIDPYAKVRDDLIKLDRLDVDRRDFYKALVDRLDQVLGDNGYIVQVQSKSRLSRRVILVRVNDGKAEICGGPFGYTYLQSGNGISPELRKLLLAADKLEIYSLDPSTRERPNVATFHGFKSLGTTINQRPDARKRLLQAIQQSIDETSAEVSTCFNPRHGIRATTNGNIVDLVISFDCFTTKVYAGDQLIETFIHNETAQHGFDDILRSSGVATAKRAKPESK